MNTYRKFLAPLDTPKLSPSELEALMLAHQNKSNAEIARALGVKVSTIHTRLSNASLKYRDQEQLKSLGGLRGAPQPSGPSGMVR